MKKLIAVSAIFLSLGVFANSSKFVETNDAIEASFAQFTVDGNVEADLRSVSAKPSTNGVKVIITKNDRSKVSYSCHRHDENDPFECH